MNKTEAIQLFGSVKALSEALGIHPQAIYQWPEDIGPKRSDWITGAALRLGKIQAKSAAA